MTPKCLLIFPYIQTKKKKELCLHRRSIVIISFGINLAVHFEEGMK